MNLTKVLKQKRDAEERLRRSSPAPIFVSGESDAFITNKEIINNFSNITNDITNINNTIININSFVKQRDLLTNGDLNNTELLYANGDVIWVEV